MVAERSRRRRSGMTAEMDGCVGYCRLLSWHMGSGYCGLQVCLTNKGKRKRLACLISYEQIRI